MCILHSFHSCHGKSLAVRIPGRERAAGNNASRRPFAKLAKGVGPLNLPPRGTEQPAESPVNRGIPKTGDAESDAKPPISAPLDPELQAVIAAWPALPDALKAGILAMVKAAGNAHQEAEPAPGRRAEQGGNHAGR